MVNSKIKKQRDSFQDLHEKQTNDPQALTRKQRESYDEMAKLKPQVSSDPRLIAEINEVNKSNKQLVK